MRCQKLSVAVCALLALSEADALPGANAANAVARSVSSANLADSASATAHAVASAAPAAVHSQSHIGLRSNVGSGAVSNEKEPDTKNKALKVSPQDKIYDPHEIDDDGKFHAPSLAPNDVQSVPADAALEEKRVEKTTAGEAEKGSKGSVILDDYDPTRLGVSADEAHNSKSKDAVAKQDSKGSGNAAAAAKEGYRDLSQDEIVPKDSAKALKDEFETGGKKGGAAPKEKDGKKIADENKASSQEKSSAKTTSEDAKMDDSKNRDAEARRQHAGAYEKAKEVSGGAAAGSAAAASVEGEAEEHQIGRFIGSAMMIVVSEIGDKTFFIAALMAMRHKPFFVFTSSYSAMVIMTILSMVLGLILPSLISRRVTTLLAALLFLVFGARMIKEAWSMDKNLVATEEMEEVEHDLALSEKTYASEKAEGGGYTSEDTRSRFISHSKNLAKLVFSPVWIQIFVMTFLGEWGDRSQIATVAMGAGSGWAAVLSGCLLGHFATTAIAVLGGKILAKHLSLRTITFSGAICFLLFAGIYFHDWINQ